jgi:hypothetical protein
MTLLENLTELHVHWLSKVESPTGITSCPFILMSNAGVTDIIVPLSLHLNNSLEHSLEII